jgi:hypothetical protein
MSSGPPQAREIELWHAAGEKCSALDGHRRKCFKLWPVLDAEKFLMAASEREKMAVNVQRTKG